MHGTRAMWGVKRPTATGMFGVHNNPLRQYTHASDPHQKGRTTQLITTIIRIRSPTAYLDCSPRLIWETKNYFYIIYTNDYYNIG